MSTKVCSKLYEDIREDDPPGTPDTKRRKCTDVLFLVLFGVFIIGMFIVLGVAVDRGDHKRIVNGIDFRGCTCDTECGGVDRGRLSVFVKMYDTDTFGKSAVLACSTACPVGLPPYSDQIACYPIDDELFYPAGNTIAAQQASLSTYCTGRGIVDCNTWTFENCGISYASNAIFGYCTPIANSTFIREVEDSLDDERWTEVFESFENGAWIIFASCIVAFLFAFLYLYLLSKFVKPVTYISMVLVLVFLVVGGIFLFQRSQDIKDSYEGDNSDGYKDDYNWRLNFWGSVVIFIVAGLYLCFLVFMFKRIKLAVEVLVDAGEAILDSPYIFFLPLLVGALGVGIFAAWCVTAVMLFSAGEVEAYDPDGSGPAPSGVLKRVEIDDQLRNLIIYHIFGLFWIVQFLIALVELTIALVCSRWFFTPRVGDEKQGLPEHPTLLAFGIAVRFHLGTIAFGSLIIAVVQAIRAVFEYVDKKVRKASGNSRIVQCASCCCRCCLWCLEKCLRFLNRQAYIQVALTGDSFCTAARKAFNIVLNNALRYGALTVVGTSFIFLGKLFVAGLSTLFAFAILTKADRYSDDTRETAVANPFVVAVVVFILAYALAAMFFSLLETAMDTILMCYIVDEENPGEHRGERAKADELQSKNKQVMDHGMVTHGFYSRKDLVAGQPAMGVGPNDARVAQGTVITVPASSGSEPHVVSGQPVGTV